MRSIRPALARTLLASAVATAGLLSTGVAEAAPAETAPADTTQTRTASAAAVEGDGVATRTYVLKRTTSGPAHLILNADLGYLEGDRPFFATAFLRPGASGRLTESTFSVVYNYGTDPFPVVYTGGGGRFESCTAIGDATSGDCPIAQDGSAFTALAYSDDGGPRAGTVAVITVRGRDPQARLLSRQTKGWSIREATLPVRTTFADDKNTQATSVVTSTGGVELFESATARGFRRGSVAIAQPPCGRHSALATGAGSFTLTGGTREPESNCPVQVADPTSFRANEAVAAAAYKRTKWTFEGVVAGAFTLQSDLRLVVVRLPREARR